jgi:Leucine rich repeat/Leucine Rich Repeat
MYIFQFVATILCPLGVQNNEILYICAIFVPLFFCFSKTTRGCGYFSCFNLISQKHCFLFISRIPLFVLLFFVATTIAEVCNENECQFTKKWMENQKQPEQWDFTDIESGKITKVTFEPNITSSLPTNFLEAFTSLTVFNASHQNISRIDARLFGGYITNNTMVPMETNNMHEIDLSNNIIQMIPATAFSKVPYLELLDLSHNNIKNVQTDAFLKLQNLKHLKLNNNNLATINKTTFQHLETISDIDLSHNHLKSINLDDFASITSLLSISLASNKLTEVFANEMGGAVEQIDLSKNDLANIAGIKSFGNVTTLNLSGNPNLKLSNSDFQKMGELINLYLIDTGVEIFDLASLQLFPKLQSMSLKTIDVSDSNIVKTKFPELKSLVTSKTTWTCPSNTDFLSCSDSTTEDDMSTEVQQPTETHIGTPETTTTTTTTGATNTEVDDDEGKEKVGSSNTLFYIFIILLVVVAIFVISYFVLKHIHERETTSASTNTGDVENGTKADENTKKAEDVTKDEPEVSQVIVTEPANPNAATQDGETPKKIEEISKDEPEVPQVVIAEPVKSDAASQDNEDPKKTEETTKGEPEVPQVVITEPVANNSDSIEDTTNASVEKSDEECVKE